MNRMQTKEVLRGAGAQRKLLETIKQQKNFY